MAKKVGKKKDIQQYDHRDKKRINNPPVGLVPQNPTDEPAEKLLERIKNKKAGAYAKTHK